MPVGSCDRPDCENEYTYAERGEPSPFVSIAVTPHDVDGIEQRAMSVCAECGRELDAMIPGDDDADA